MTNFEKPVIVDPAQLDDLRAKNQPTEIDIYDQQCQEIARINNPADKDAQPADVSDAWVYYPWSNKLLHCVDREAFFTIRTNRNRELISSEEQATLAKATVGVVGMSVGSGIAIGLHYSGISRTIKIADNDTLDTSNLNRLRESVLDVGRPKTILAAERMYELDPFSDVRIFDQGVTDENIDEFFLNPKLDIVIDEIDDFKMKVRLRQRARKYKIPLLMFTSLGDNILVDVERFDLDPEAPIFNGLLGDEGEEIVTKTDISPADIRRYSVTLVGQEYIPTKALQSVAQMGRSLVGRPQLYSTIAVDGGLAAYVVRQIILHSKPVSGRYFVRFADLFNIKNQELSSSAEREEILNQLRG